MTSFATGFAMGTIAGFVIAYVVLLAIAWWEERRESNLWFRVYALYDLLVYRWNTRRSR